MIYATLFAKVSFGTGFEPVLNLFQSTALTTELQLPQYISINYVNIFDSKDLNCIFMDKLIVEYVLNVRLVPNQSENGKYNLISV